MPMFTGQFNNVAVTVAQDLFEVNAPSGSALCVHGCTLFQTSDVGDAAEEILRLLWIKNASTSGSGGTNPTAVCIDNTASTFGGTVEVNNTTAATGGTPLTMRPDGWNVRGTYDFIPTPETRLWIPAAGRLVLNLPSAPADSLTVSGVITVETF